VNTLLRITGIDKLISFYRFIYFNGPGFVKFSGIGLILVIGLTHMYVFPEHFEAKRYIGLSFAALFAGTLLSALWILKGLRWGWALGSILCGVAIVGYVVSRTWGLPGLPGAIGRWDEPAGTFAVASELFFIFLYFSIVTGMNVAASDRRDWHD
jgi:hypothetical protein